MGTPTSILANQDVRNLLDRALANPQGVELTLPLKEAYGLRHRIYSLRKTDRRQSCDLYSPEDPRHGVSTYDILAVYLQITEGEPTCVLSILKGSVDWSTVRDI